MPSNAILLYPYAIDWLGREEAKQALLRAFLAHGADLSREFHGPAFPTAKTLLAFDVALSRFVDQARRLSGLAAEPFPSAQYRMPSAFVVMAHAHPFDQRIVQLIQRLVSAAPGLAGAALVLVCDFRADRTLAPALKTYGELDRDDPLQLPVLTLSSTRSRLLVVGHDIVYPLAELSGRLRDLLTPPRQRTGPRPSPSEPAFPAPSVPRRASSEMPAFVLDDALRTGEGKK